MDKKVKKVLREQAEMILSIAELSEVDLPAIFYSHRKRYDEMELMPTRSGKQREEKLKAANELADDIDRLKHKIGSKIISAYCFLEQHHKNILTKGVRKKLFNLD